MQEALGFTLTVIGNIALFLLALLGVRSIVPKAWERITCFTQRRKRTVVPKALPKVSTRPPEYQTSGKCPFNISQVVPGHPEYILRADTPERFRTQAWQAAVIRQRQVEPEAPQEPEIPLLG